MFAIPVLFGHQMGPSKTDDGAALVAALGFVSFGLALSIFVKVEAPAIGDAFLIAVLVMPLLSYLILSERLVEFQGPAGIGGKLRQAGKTPVMPLVRIAVRELMVVPKGNRAQLSDALHYVSQTSDLPIVLTLRLGQQDYTSWMFDQYIAQLNRYRGFAFVVVIDEADRVIAYLPADLLQLPTIRNEGLLAQLLFNIGQHNVSYVRHFPEMLTETVGDESTIFEALKVMDRHKLRRALVVTTDQLLVGIVDREDLVVQLLMAVVA